MKCFTISPQYDLLPTIHTVGLGMGYANMRIYRLFEPDVLPGIELGSDGQVELGPDVAIGLSSDLLHSTTGAIDRTSESGKLLQASLQRVTNGRAMLTPEVPGDENAALVLISLGADMFQRMEYAVAPHQRIAEFAERDFSGESRIALVRLETGDEILARRVCKQFVFWGKDVVVETITITYDGDKPVVSIRKLGAKA